MTKLVNVKELEPLEVELRGLIKTLEDAAVTLSRAADAVERVADRLKELRAE